ncbi:MAG TPA: hypothetical protein VJ814_01930, partial [Gaiellaceae bacterium]|nr:hypothetical protein [Gaiellaceae bacterium]
MLPLAAAAWAVAGLEAARSRTHAEAVLQAQLRKASIDYREALAAAGKEAHALASSHRVQRAFERHDRRALDRLARPNVRFVLGARRPSSNGVPSRSIRIVRGGHRIGTVTVRVPFDQRLLARLERSSLLPRDRELAFVHGRSLVRASGARASIPTVLPLDRPAQVLVGGERYVAVSTVVTREAPATRLV